MKRKTCVRSGIRELDRLHLGSGADLKCARSQLLRFDGSLCKGSTCWRKRNATSVEHIKFK